MGRLNETKETKSKKEFLRSIHFLSLKTMFLCLRILLILWAYVITELGVVVH